jgi:hypothetical protein
MNAPPRAFQLNRTIALVVVGCGVALLGAGVGFGALVFGGSSATAPPVTTTPGDVGLTTSFVDCTIEEGREFCNHRIELAFVGGCQYGAQRWRAEVTYRVEKTGIVTRRRSLGPRGCPQPPIPNATPVAPSTVPTVPQSIVAPHAWRLGYAGLGPIQLGMTFPVAQLAGGLGIRVADGGCSFLVDLDASLGVEPVRSPGGQLNSGLSIWPTFPFSDPRIIAEIGVANPAFYTISGVHVGSTYDEVLRTYPNAEETILGREPDGRAHVALTIRNAEGRIIEFAFNLDRILRFMILGLTQADIESHRNC